jgi:hypothetical protein
MLKFGDDDHNRGNSYSNCGKKPQLLDSTLSVLILKSNRQIEL